MDIETYNKAIRDAMELCDKYKDEAGGSQSYKQACWHLKNAIALLAKEQRK